MKIKYPVQNWKKRFNYNSACPTIKAKNASLSALCDSFFSSFYWISIVKTAKICYNTLRIGGSDACRQLAPYPVGGQK